MGKLLLFSLGLVLLLVISVEAGKTKGKRYDLQRRGSGRKAGGGGALPAKRKSKLGRKARRRKQRKNKPKKKKTNKKQGKRANQPGKKRAKKAKPRSECSRQTTTFCPAEKALALKLLYGQVANFFRQLKRAENHAKIVLRKKEKKDNFESDAAILQDAVGGNISDPTCASGRRSASTAAEQGETLSNCSNSIGAACADVTVNTTLLGDCKTKMEAYQSKVTTCKTDDSCTCWTEATNMKSEITDCKATDEMNRVKALKGSCLEKFSDCKKAQDSAVELTASCPTQETSTPAPSMTTVAAKHRHRLDKLLAKNLIKHLSA